MYVPRTVQHRLNRPARPTLSPIMDPGARNIERTSFPPPKLLHGLIPTVEGPYQSTCVSHLESRCPGALRVSASSTQSMHVINDQREFIAEGSGMRTAHLTSSSSGRLSSYAAVTAPSRAGQTRLVQAVMPPTLSIDSPGPRPSKRMPQLGTRQRAPRTRVPDLVRHFWVG